MGKFAQQSVLLRQFVAPLGWRLALQWFVAAVCAQAVSAGGARAAADGCRRRPLPTVCMQLSPPRAIVCGSTWAAFICVHGLRAAAARGCTTVCFTALAAGPIRGVEGAARGPTARSRSRPALLGVAWVRSASTAASGQQLMEGRRKTEPCLRSGRAPSCAGPQGRTIPLPSLSRAAAPHRRAFAPWPLEHRQKHSQISPPAPPSPHS
jgi:hypothetical protein